MSQVGKQKEMNWHFSGTNRSYAYKQRPKSRIMLAFFIAFIFKFSCDSSDSNSNPLDYETVKLEDLDLNRTAQPLTPFQRIRFGAAHTGFIWNDGDNNTNKWRPQGIAGASTENRKFLLVSWYGRKEADYENRGVRISAVDVTNMSQVKYRHILLVDENLNTFEDMHAGGLVYRKGKLHVPDSRAGAKKIYVFDIESIKLVPVNDRSKFYNYKYILIRESSYDVPIKPSFLSFDWDRDQILVGSFYQCSDRHKDTPDCILSAQNRLAWYSIGQVNSNSPFCAPFFSEMQGAASAKDPNSDQQILWIASSLGKSNPSHLHIMRKNSGACFQSGLNISDYRKIDYPPGLEDMHISLSSNNIWMLTEFGPHEGSRNNRVVFATRKERLMP
jgi:hypothetical protein